MDTGTNPEHLVSLAKLATSSLHHHHHQSIWWKKNRIIIIIIIIIVSCRKGTSLYLVEEELNEDEKI